MSGKNLTFKLVMDADTKGFVTNINQSTKSATEAIAAIKDGTAQLVVEAKKVADSVDSIVPSETKQKVAQLVTELHSASKALDSMGSDADLSAENLKQLGDYGEQALQGLQNDLKQAKLHLNYLAATHATPEDIDRAQQEVKELETGVKQVKVAFQGLQSQTEPALQTIEANAKEVQEVVAEIVPSQTKQRVSQLVTELNFASKSLDSMGHEATLSTENLKQLGEYGEQALQGIQEDLKQAKQHLNYLSATNATPADIQNAQQEVKELEVGVKQVKTAFEAYNGSAESAASSTAEVDHAIDGLAKESQETATQINKLDQELSETNKELQQTESFTQRASGEIQGLKTGFSALTGALATLGIGTSAMEIAQTADEFKNLSGRVNIAIGENGNLEKSMDDIKNVAISTNSNLTATGDLFSRLTKIGQEVKWSQEQVLALTKTINKAIQVGGGSAATNEAAITQLNQALASGVLRGDEFNSMVEQSPRLTQAMADGLGVTIGKLRAMAETGQLTTEVVTKALLSQSEKISSEFAKFPTTIGASIENLKTAWTVYIGEADAASGISAKVAQAIKFVADNLDLVISTLTAAAQAFIAYKALGMAAIFLEKANAARGAQIAIATETAALNANVVANIENARATQLTAVAKTELAVATNASTIANTAAVGSFDKVTAAAGGLKTGLVSVLSRFGAYGVAAAGIVIAGDLIVDGLKKTDEWLLRQGSNFIDWSVSRITGTKSLVQQEKELIAAEDASRKKQEEAAAAKEKNAARTEMLKNASYGLNEASKATVLEFDKQVKAGEKVSEALDGIAKSFNFDSTTGINNGITALLALQTQGKASGDEIRKALVGSLKDIDLSEFQGKLAAIPVNIEKQIEVTNAKIKVKQIELDEWKKANQGMAYNDWLKNVNKYRTDIEKLQAETSALHVQYANSVQGAAMVQGAILDEAIRRTGLSYEELSGESTKAFTSANNDVNVLVGNLDELKGKGVDVGRALDASISNAINTATNQKEIDALKAKINSLRGVLGEKVADGLLRQAEQQLIDIKDKADQARAGINSVQEAFNLFGMKTPAQLKVVAEQYKAAFDEMKKSGQATLSQQQEAFKQYAEKAIAANKGVANSIILNEAASLGLKIQTDETGKASVKAMDEWTRSNERVRNSAESIGDGYRNAGSVAREEAKSAEQAWSDAVDAASAEFDAEMKRQGESLSKGIYNYNSYSKAEVIEQIKSKGYSDSEATELANNLWQKGREADRDAKNDRVRGGNVSMNALIKQEFDNAAAKGLTTQWGTNKINDLLRQMESKGSTSAPDVDVNSLAPSVNTAVPSIPTTDVSKNSRIELVSGNKTANLTGSQQDVDIMEEMLREFEMLKKGS